MQRRGTWRKRTGGLALFALALQLVVSFAHVHSEDFAGLLGPGVTHAAPANDAPGGHPDPDHLTCDVCATVHLAGTLAVPTPPALTLPVPATAPVAVAAPATRALTFASAFLARGPPQA